eukprot:4943273-Prymnesium_polylepis.1
MERQTARRSSQRAWTPTTASRSRRGSQKQTGRAWPRGSGCRCPGTVSWRARRQSGRSRRTPMPTCN